MNGRLPVVAGFLFVLFGLSGCRSSPPANEKASVHGDSAGRPGRTTAIELERASSGRSVTVAVTGVIRVTLPSNPTTGYRWVWAGGSDDRLENTRKAHVPDRADGRVGSGGREVWEFTARAPGESVLRLEYRRPWEPREVDPADRFEVLVKVTAEQTR